VPSGEHLEGDVGLESFANSIVSMPPALGNHGRSGLAAERIAARPGEGMPVGDCKAQMFHPLAGDDLVGIVEPVGQRIGQSGPLFDLLDVAGRLS
jgi:hypothetical protein